MSDRHAEAIIQIDAVLDRWNEAYEAGGAEEVSVDALNEIIDIVDQMKKHGSGWLSSLIAMGGTRTCDMVGCVDES